MNCQVNELILHDVRCFSGEQRGKIKPITLLVGENSTGKSTFLGCHSVLHRLFTETWNLDRQLDFNKEPFLMGSFLDILNSRSTRENDEEQFRIGLNILPIESEKFPAYSLFANFTAEGSQPIVSSLNFQFDEDKFVEFRRGDDGDTLVTFPGVELPTPCPYPFSIFLLDIISSGLFDKLLSTDENSSIPFPASLIVDHVVGEVLKTDIGKWKDFFKNLRIERPILNDINPVAPLRSKPKRTYDPVRETPSPEGEHIPMLMMRLDKTDEHHWNLMRNRLIEFGNKCGLFSDIAIKHLGEQMNDPFQLHIEVRSGATANILDVGYGVSQILPILIDVLAAEEGVSQHSKRGCTFALQQPEVHLHPRAQAELASFFIESYNNSGIQYLIETHSDNFIDRFRIAVRTGILNAKDVSILYFDPMSDGVAIHNISLDEHGNIFGAPEGYRSFFQTETDRLLGFKD